MAPDRQRPPQGSGRRPARRYAALAGAISAALLCQAALAQMYVCTVNGRTYTGQQPPFECRNSDLRELNADGSLHRIIPAPRTPEQIRRDEEARQAQLEKEEEARSQARKDRALLETYASVEEIEQARKRDLGGRQILIDRADSRIAQYHKERKRLDDEAEFYVNREMPRKLKDAFATNKTLTDQQEKTRADSVAEMARINERYDAARRRFEDIESAARQAEDERRRASEQLRQDPQ